MGPQKEPTVDFGRAAGDYAKHRPGFPAEFFEHVKGLGIGVAGQRVLDLGTGTGTLACGFAARGCEATGLDPSAEMLAEAEKAAAASGLSVRWVKGLAEATGLPDGAFDVACAGQCWHWFDRPRAAAEVMRVLRPGGRALIGYFSYLPSPGSMAAATEDLILVHNPSWQWAGHDGRYGHFVPDLEQATFGVPRTFEFTLPIPFTHEGWRGRIRACNGVLRMPSEKIAVFDAELARMLSERFADPVVVDHRIFGIVSERPSSG
jgi:SAM-dependent methyltransferase